MTRLDRALVERGLCPSRTAAVRAIEEGRVRVSGRQALRPAKNVDDADEITIERVERYVSRAARKLIHLLNEQPDLRVEDRTCLDVGASTGGFTQVLLERGAKRVVALDVGHGQLHPLVRSDSRVIPIEGENARYLTRERLRDRIAESGRWHGADPDEIDLVVADLSFISITQVLPSVRGAVSEGSSFVTLIKPQFEVGRLGVKEGIVRDPVLAADALERVVWSAWDAGLGLEHITESPILGTHGNREFIARFEAAATGSHRHPEAWIETVRALAGVSKY